MSDPSRAITSAKARGHDLTFPLLGSMYVEFKDLCKKKPEAVMNEKKIKIVNRLLERVQEVLEGEQSIEFLDILDEDDVPQISDVTLILSQYMTAMKEFKKNYHFYADGVLEWQICD